MRVLAVLVLVVAVATPAIGLEVRQRTLANGLQIFVAENHGAPVFTMRVYVKAGSIYEDEYLGCGISHFCEHLVSGGTTHRRAEAETERILGSIGGAHNAYTTSDHTCYFIETSEEYADSVIDLLSDWVLNCAIPEEEYERERGVILREISMGMDEPGRRIGKLYNGAMFAEHPEHFPVIGYTELFEKITHNDVVTYYERMYVPTNMHVVAVGAFDAEEILDKIEAAFAAYPYEAPVSIYLPSDRKQLGSKYAEDEMDIDLTYMTMGWMTVTITNEDTYPLHVLARILGDGRSSRLYREVRERLGLVHTIDARSYNPQYDAPDFTVHVTCDYEKAAEARKSICDVIYQLRDTYVSRKELEKAKTQIASDLAFGFQSVEGQASRIGIDVLRTGSPDYSKVYLKRIEEVSRDDIRRVVNEYLYDDAMTVAVLKAAGAEVSPEEAVEVSQAVTPVSKTNLENGATLLLKENHNVPLVHIRAYFGGGSSLENPETNGAFNLMARMLRRGTRRRSAEAIARQSDEMGARLYTGSNEDYFSCSMDVLSENFEEGLAFLADLIVNSVFPADDFRKERDNVLSQIRQRNDSWQDDAEVRMRKVLYGKHPYGMDPMGEEESVSALSRDYLYGLYNRYCVPENMVLAVFGDVDSGSARLAVAKTFGRFTREGAGLPSVETWEGLEDDILSIQASEREQAVIFMGYPCMDPGNPDWYAMRVLDAVISGIGYPGGWLHQTLRGQRLVYVVHAWNNVLPAKGYFAIMAATTPEHADSAVGIIREKIEKAKTEYVSDVELEMAKRICTIMEDLYYSQTTAAQADLAAEYELLGLGYDYRDKLKERIEAVSKDDVREVAGRYLTESATVIIQPEGEEYRTSMK
jgi:zinc protease